LSASDSSDPRDHALVPARRPSHRRLPRDCRRDRQHPRRPPQTPSHPEDPQARRQDHPNMGLELMWAGPVRVDHALADDLVDRGLGESETRLPALVRGGLAPWTHTCRKHAGTAAESTTLHNAYYRRVGGRPALPEAHRLSRDSHHVVSHVVVTVILSFDLAWRAGQCPADQAGQVMGFELVALGAHDPPDARAGSGLVPASRTRRRS
jgi:hypothetical protein